MKRLALITALLLSPGVVAQDSGGNTTESYTIEQGVELYDQGNFERSLSIFKTLNQSQPGDPLTVFNTISLQAITRKLNEAEQWVEANTNLPQLTPTQRSDAFYNMGTSYLSIAQLADANDQLTEAAQELERSAHWLRQSLLSNADNFAAKNNLEIANKLLEKLQQQQNQSDSGENNQENSQDGNETEDSKDSQQQDNEQNQDESQQQDQQQKGDQNQQQQQGQDKQQQKPKEISKEMAKNLLEAAKEKEKQALQAIRAQQARDKKSKDGKDY